MTDDTVTSAVAKREAGPRALVRAYSDDFAMVLPTHVKAATWVRLAQGALKKGKKATDGSGRTELEVAAANNPGTFLSALLDAARLGLEPGTEQYYLTPRKVKGRGLEILGIVGYQGHIELMYRAGAVSSVVAEVVYTGDEFIWAPGKLDSQRPPRWEGPMERPLHEIDWDAEDRGELRLVYAYALMKDGATSKVVVLNRADITRIRASATGADSEYSPWRTHEAAMWLKSGVRQLQKWVPTSAEYIREQRRAERDVVVENAPPIAQSVELAPVDITDSWVDAELVEDLSPEPESPGATAGEQPAPVSDVDPEQAEGDAIDAVRDAEDAAHPPKGT